MVDLNVITSARIICDTTRRRTGSGHMARPSPLRRRRRSRRSHSRRSHQQRPQQRPRWVAAAPRSYGVRDNVHDDIVGPEVLPPRLPPTAMTTRRCLAGLTRTTSGNGGSTKMKYEDAMPSDLF